MTTPERALEALHALQHARYVEGRNNTDPAVMADVLSSLGLQAPAACLHAPHDALLAVLLERVAAARAVCICSLGWSAALQMLAIASAIAALVQPSSPSRSAAHTYRTTRAEVPRVLAKVKSWLVD